MFSAHLSRCRLPILCPGALLILLLPCRGAFSQSTGQMPNARMEVYIGKRLRESPDDAAAWRMLGRIRLQQKRLAEARSAFQQSVKLDPTSAAAHFDLGRVLVELGKKDEARIHLKQVVKLAPESDYALDARPLLDRIGEGESDVKRAGYQIRRFDGTQSVEPLLREKTEQERRSGLFAPFGFRLEAGALYNSNVALAPVSRELSPQQPASAQGFVAPELEWVFLDRQKWRAGTTLAGYFNLNEGNFRQFNLQSYQPGLFVESFHAVGTVVLIPRVSYGFTHDEFDGETFGNRNALTPSLWASWNEQDSSLLYWTINYSNFLNDGAVPSITSQDGWTNVIGLSHDHLVEWRSLQLLRAGVDYMRADTRGSDYRFNGVNLYAEAVFVLGWQTELKLTGGWGYRDYADFQFTPSRNENIWRGGTELRKYFNDHVSAALVFNYVRFDSKNPLFAAERYLTGVVTTIVY